jgi:predicted  nucleic acid-binding Zn-ribbon protein
MSKMKQENALLKAKAAKYDALEKKFNELEKKYNSLLDELEKALRELAALRERMKTEGGPCQVCKNRQAEYDALLARMAAMQREMDALKSQLDDLNANGVVKASEDTFETLYDRPTFNDLFEEEVKHIF